MQDDEEFSRKYTREELEDALNLDMYRILSNQIDHSALKARIDYLLAVESQLATVTAQRDELLAKMRNILVVVISQQQNYSYKEANSKVEEIATKAIAKCEVKNG